MAAVERLRELSGRLAAGWLTTSLLLAGCVAADQETASFDADEGTEQTLPPVTEPSTTPSTADDGGSGSTGESTSTETTATIAPLAELEGLAAEQVASGFDQPILVTSAPGTDALFVVEREGIVRTVVDGVVADEPFLDLTGELLSNSIEQGLLGLAFHPDFADNRTFYAYWTDPEGDSRLARFRTADSVGSGAGDPPVADPDSLEVVFEVDQPAERHNAGMVQFGPDGLLYLALGDGGSGGAEAQDTSNPLGSIVRIDVDAAEATAGGEPYAIPDGNPFGDEIWVYGLRNPWRFSIDPVGEMVYIGDVGQDRLEEIDVVGLDGAGTNFGWSEMEGDTCFRSGCAEDDFTDPVLEYSHDEGCSVTGGWVYRGAAIPELTGHYFYADWCGGLIRSFRLDAQGQVADQLDWSEDLAALGQVTSFGLDNDAELLAVNWGGELYRIVPVR